MKKTLTVLATAATLAIAAVSAPQQAEARGRGGAVAAGIIGGLALGAIAAGAAHSYYGPGPGYYAYGPGPVAYGPGCYWTRERVWTNWGWRFRRVRVCG